MQISRLKLSGFKSFVEPADLRIEPGLTGIVGPNGCGKSNLLEAIRWVMGETSAKSMRSGGMEDVIFAGTSTRPERAFAEVVLHASDDDGEDFVVTRRIERGAGSAYRVNGDDVRAKDVALTFADAATGAHSPALVSQGKIAQVIAAKPTQRRAMLEEAAGIAGLHVRRRDAESKLRSTESNLARLEDLMAGLDTQIASLRRQAKQAERYRKLTAEIALAEGQLLFARWRDAAQEAKDARAAAQLADERVAKAQSLAQAAQTEQTQSAKRLATTREALARKREEAAAHEHRLAALRAKLESAETRIADLTRQRERLEEDRAAADKLTADAVEALGRLEAERKSSQARLSQAEAARPALASASEEAERVNRAAELALARATADQAGVEAEWRVAQAAIEHATSRLERLKEEVARIEDASAQLTGGDDPELAVGMARQTVDDALRRVAQARKAIDRAQTRKARLASERDDAAADLSGARAELTGLEREYQALARDRDARLKRAGSREGRPRAIDAVRAAPGVERALAAALGRDAKSPLAKPETDEEGRFWSGQAADAAPVEDTLLAHVIDCPAQLQPRLARVHYALHDDGRTLAPGEWLVTKSGQLRRWDGLIVRGEGSAEAARLEAANRLAELEEVLPERRATAEAAARVEAATRSELAAAQAEIVTLDRGLAEAIEAERAALRSLDAAEASRERLAARLEELAHNAKRASEQLAAARTELGEAEAHLEALPKPDAGRSQLDAARETNETSRLAVQATLAQLAAHDQELAVARERLAAQKADHASWKARSGEAAQRVAQAGRRIEQIEEESAIIGAKPPALRAEIAQIEAHGKDLDDQCVNAQKALEASEGRHGEAEEALAAAQEALASAREDRATLAARAENSDARRAEFARISGERFQCPPPLLTQRLDFDADAVALADTISGELERLTANRERIGPVNLVAADELERLEGEHGTSAAEQAELAEAVARLRGSIGNLNREGRERLRAAFEEVDGHFRVLFTRLFQGGQAHLALVDSDDPLEAGLEIFAQPPGKRLQSLSLLSGGEQALTATALIFALFLTNPAPICVLDEVDAPLDDANVERFCDLLDMMVRTTKTRYLIVTHNAVTMSRMHRLFGVTMAEQGVSRLVSVDLGEAELMAAE